MRLPCGYPLLLLFLLLQRAPVTTHSPTPQAAAARAVPLPEALGLGIAGLADIPIGTLPILWAGSAPSLVVGHIV
jgi:hypothetical protein